MKWSQKNIWTLPVLGITAQKKVLYIASLIRITPLKSHQCAEALKNLPRNPIWISGENQWHWVNYMNPPIKCVHRFGGKSREFFSRQKHIHVVLWLRCGQLMLYLQLQVAPFQSPKWATWLEPNNHLVAFPLFLVKRDPSFKWLIELQSQCHLVLLMEKIRHHLGCKKTL